MNFIRNKKRTLQYVFGVVNFGIHYSLWGAPLLAGFIDLYCNGDLDDMKIYYRSYFQY